MEKLTTENEKYEKMWFEHAKRMHNELKNVNGIIRDADTMLEEAIGTNFMNKVVLLMNCFLFTNRQLIKIHLDRCSNYLLDANSMNIARIALM